MRTRSAVAGALVGLGVLVCPAAADPTSCGTPAYGYYQHAVLQPSIAVTPGGDFAFIQGTNDASDVPLVRLSNDTGRVTARGNLPGGIGAGMVVDYGRGQRTDITAVGAVDRGCFAWMTTQLSAGGSSVTRRTDNMTVDHDMELLGVGSDTIGKRDLALVESVSGPNAAHRTYLPQGFRDVSPVPKRGAVTVVDLATGGIAFKLPVPYGIGPGPISGFFSSGRDHNFAALLAAAPLQGGREVTATVEAFGAAGRRWQSRIRTMPQSGIMLATAAGPAFVTTRMETADPTVPNSELLPALTVSRRINVLDARTGRQLWTRDWPATTQLWFYSYDGDLIVDDQIGATVERLESATGRQLWKANYGLRNVGNAPHVIAGHSMLLPDALPLPMTLDLRTGAVTVRTDLVTGQTLPVIDLDNDSVPDVLHFTGNSSAIGVGGTSATTGVVRALSGTDDHEIWRTTLPPGGNQAFVDSRVVMGKPIIAIMRLNNDISAVDGRTGSVRWTVGTPGP